MYYTPGWTLPAVGPCLNRMMYTTVTHTGKVKDSPMTIPPPDHSFDYEHCTLDKLDRILPLGFRCHLEAAYSFSVLSLEVYQEGFVAIAITEIPFSHPPDDIDPQTWEPSATFRAIPLLDEIEDDAGNTYASRWRAGSGSGTGDQLRSRWVFCLCPALAESAVKLRLTLRYVMDLRYEADGSVIWSDVDNLPGPWRIDVPLVNHLEGAS